ncbi:MAG: type II secretion system minor pseudopilin GspK [Nitrospirota bacterium]
MTKNAKDKGQRAKRNCKNSFNSSGSALIVTLLLISILTGLVVDFVYDVHIDTSFLSNWSNAQKAALIAKSGQNLSTMYFDDIKNDKYTDQHDLEMPVGQYLGANVELIIKIEDENSKFNINSIIYQQNRKTDEKQLSSLKKLFEYLNINPDLYLVIADWIDTDMEPRLADSEDGAKNTFLWSVDELKLIEGIDKKTFDRISPYITVFGNGKVNINTADVPVLVCLAENMTELLANKIIEYRNDSPFKHFSHVQHTGIEYSVAQHFTLLNSTVKSTFFRVTASSSVNGITRVIESVMDTSMKVHFWREG